MLKWPSEEKQQMGIYRVGRRVGNTRRSYQSVLGADGTGCHLKGGLEYVIKACVHSCWQKRWFEPGLGHMKNFFIFKLWACKSSFFLNCMRHAVELAILLWWVRTRVQHRNVVNCFTEDCNWYCAHLLFPPDSERVFQDKFVETCSINIRSYLFSSLFLLCKAMIELRMPL